VDEGVHHLVDSIVLIENNLFQFSTDGFKLFELIFFLVQKATRTFSLKG